MGEGEPGAVGLRERGEKREVNPSNVAGKFAEILPAESPDKRFAVYREAMRFFARVADDNRSLLKRINSFSSRVNRSIILAAREILVGTTLEASRRLRELLGQRGSFWEIFLRNEGLPGPAGPTGSYSVIEFLEPGEERVFRYHDVLGLVGWLHRWQEGHWKDSEVALNWRLIGKGRGVRVENLEEGPPLERNRIVWWDKEGQRWVWKEVGGEARSLASWFEGEEARFATVVVVPDIDGRAEAQLDCVLKADPRGVVAVKLRERGRGEGVVKGVESAVGGIEVMFNHSCIDGVPALGLVKELVEWVKEQVRAVSGESIDQNEGEEEEGSTPEGPVMIQFVPYPPYPNLRGKKFDRLRRELEERWEKAFGKREREIAETLGLAEFTLAWEFGLPHGLEEVDQRLASPFLPLAELARYLANLSEEEQEKISEFLPVISGMRQLPWVKAAREVGLPEFNVVVKTNQRLGIATTERGGSESLRELMQRAKERASMVRKSFPGEQSIPEPGELMLGLNSLEPEEKQETRELLAQAWREYAAAAVKLYGDINSVRRGGGIIPRAYLALSVLPRRVARLLEQVSGVLLPQQTKQVAAETGIVSDIGSIEGEIIFQSAVSARNPVAVGIRRKKLRPGDNRSGERIIEERVVTWRERANDRLWEEVVRELDVASRDKEAENKLREIMRINQEGYLSDSEFEELLAIARRHQGDLDKVLKVLGEGSPERRCSFRRLAIDVARRRFEAYCRKALFYEAVPLLNDYLQAKDGILTVIGEGARSDLAKRMIDLSSRARQYLVEEWRRGKLTRLVTTAQKVLDEDDSDEIKLAPGIRRRVEKELKRYQKELDKLEGQGDRESEKELEEWLRANNPNFSRENLGEERWRELKESLGFCILIGPPLRDMLYKAAGVEANLGVADEVFKEAETIAEKYRQRRK